VKNIDQETVDRLIKEITPLRERDFALALDFDGVCKLFTEHKHQIMCTCLFLHLYEFQRVPFKVYREVYNFINFKSPDYAGKERFLCVSALAQDLAKKGYNCALPELTDAVTQLQEKGLKIAEDNLLDYQKADQVARAIAWSREVNEKVSGLTEIGLTPGIAEHIFTPFKEKCDFYVVSTATEKALVPLMEKEGIDFILCYLGQETATKGESLTAFSHSGYKAVFMFGDSMDDTRVATIAKENSPDAVPVLFGPVIPGDEERCFSIGKKIIDSALSGNTSQAEQLSRKLADEFEGREAGK